MNTLDGRPTRVIAHRGASGELPEHTLAAYALALAQGADVIEPDLHLTADGVLVARHDWGLRRSTDVSAHPALAEYASDGDWPLPSLRHAQLSPVRAVQPWPRRPHDQDGLHAIPTFEEVLAWAAREARARGRRVLLYPELKEPARHAGQGLDIVQAFIDAVRTVDPAEVGLWTQCFEPGPLLRLRAATGLPAFLLLEDGADWRDALARHRDELDGLAVPKRSLDAELVAACHAAGRQVHAWTYRDDVLPPGVARVEDELAQAFALGVDAVFCDFPATGLRARS